jgi:hypothetical protein
MKLEELAERHGIPFPARRPSYHGSFTLVVGRHWGRWYGLRFRRGNGESCGAGVVRAPESEDFELYAPTARERRCFGDMYTAGRLLAAVPDLPPEPEPAKAEQALDPMGGRAGRGAAGSAAAAPGLPGRPERPGAHRIEGGEEPESTTKPGDSFEPSPEARDFLDFL